MVTTKFLHRCGFDDNLVLVETYQKVDIVEDCIEALREGVGDYRVITTAASTTHSMFYEILENVKEALVQLSQKVLSALNNYLLNNVKIIDKYRELILDRLPRNGRPPIVHETYEYPECPDYPKSIKSTVSAVRDVQRLQNDILTGSYGPNYIATKVDQLLEEFGKDVLGMRPDPLNLKESTKKIVLDKVRGGAITVALTRETFGKFIDQVTSYKKDKDDIIRTRKNVLEDYETLKRTYSDVTKDALGLAKSRGQIRTMADPDREAFIAAEYQRYADIHVEMMRLFNGYIAIYQAAFDTKLSELNNKINDNRNLINTVMVQTGVFAALNTKNPDKNRKPIPYDPSLRV